MKAVLLLRNEAEDTFGLVPAALEAEDVPTATLDAWDGGAWRPGSVADFSSGVRATPDDLRRLGIPLDA